MKNIYTVIRCYLPIHLIVLLFSVTSFSQTITFDDTDPQIMVLKNGSSYEIAFFKLTGAFAYIKDESASVEFVSGEPFDDLWLIEFTDRVMVRSSEYYPGEPKDFSYSWNDNLNTLTMIYTPDPHVGNQVNVIVTVTLYDSAYFDLQIHINNFDSKVINNVEFPRNMNVLLGQGDRAYFPVVYPGLMFGSDFFEGENNMVLECDFLSLQLRGGDISLYQLYNDTLRQIVEEGLFAEPDGLPQKNYFCNLKYLSWIGTGASWTSQVSRFRIGQTPWETIQAFRVDNGVEEFPSLGEKLGEKLDAYSRSPIYDHAHQFWDPPAFYYSDIPDQFKSYPVPAIFFLIAYYPARCPLCSGYTPDYYPPEPLFGTTEDFLRMIDTLQSRGYLVMMGSQSTLWDDGSPTVLNLPGEQTIEDIAALKRDSTPAYYSTNPGEHSFFVSPSNSFVQQRNEVAYDIFFNTYGADMVYEDAVMSPGPYDFNANAESPLSIRQEWVDFFRARGGNSIVPEGHYIPMAEYITGSMGTSIDGFGGPNQGWDYAADDGFWRPYPLLSRLYNDKVITYPSMGSFSGDKDVISWNILFSCPNRIDLDEMSERPYWIIEEHDGWIPVIHDFQGRVTSRTIGKQLIDYVDLEGSATLADYGNISIIRNWDPVISYTHGSHAIAPLGIFAQSESGDIEAGILTRYNGADLSSGDHYLIVETFSDSIEVRHSMGNTTPIQITIPEDWTEHDQIHVHAISKDSIKGIVPALGSGYIQFQLQEAVADTARILKYLVLYGDSLQNTSVIPKRSEAGSLECYPNPFSNSTRISYEVSNPGNVYVKIMDMSGKVVCILYDGTLIGGRYNMEWDGKNIKGLELPTGIYLISCSTPDGSSVKKIVKL